MHDDKLMKLIQEKKKKGSDMSDNEKKAKKVVIDHMKKMAQDAMGESLMNGAAKKKVVVSGDSKESVEKGLDVAKDLLKNTPMEDKEEEMEGEDVGGKSLEQQVKEVMAKKDGQDLPAEESEEAAEPEENEEDEIAKLEKRLAELKAKKA